MRSLELIYKKLSLTFILKAKLIRPFILKFLQGIWEPSSHYHNYTAEPPAFGEIKGVSTSEHSDQSLLVCEIIFMAMVSLLPGENNSFCLTYLFCARVSRYVRADRGHMGVRSLLPLCRS